ncbi:MAG: hypothetical protein HPKKFMNG_02908 [Planctomycetes bacterium]|nr:hypothetical protein [Planctomycetota bacterium]HRJ79884.1 phosphatase PAP2 family protein [Planctomycetota bacterium]
MAGTAQLDSPVKRASGSHESVAASNLSKPRPAPWRWLFRVFRFEEAVIFALLAVFALVLFSVDGAPAFSYLWAGFTYNFHGNGTMWMFLQWCTLGTFALLVVAALPMAAGGKAARLMEGVWRGQDGVLGRAKATLAWGAGGIRAYVPFLACMGVYEMLKRLIPAVRGSRLYDVEMARFDYWLLGDLSAAIVRKAMHADWINALLAALPFELTQLDIHEACYISYVYAAPALALSLWFLGRREHFDRFIGAITLCGALAYVGYVLVPVVGPKYVFPDRWLEASPAALSFMDDIKGMNRDCFPSLHTAWTTLFLISAWRGCRPLFWVYLPVGIGVYIATLYGGYHYIPDIIAGHLLAVFAFWAARPLREWWNRRAGFDDSKGTSAL